MIQIQKNSEKTVKTMRMKKTCYCNHVKNNQVLQKTSSQVLNQLKKESFKDETEIKDLHEQKNQLILRLGKINDDSNYLKNIMKDLHQIVTKVK